MDKAMELLEQLAYRLGIAVEYLWSTLVKQQYVEGVTNITMAGIGIIVIIVLLCYIPRATKFAANQHKELEEDRRKNGTGYSGSYSISGHKEDYYHGLKIAIPIFGVVIITIMIVCVTSNIKDGIQQLLNPDYFALKEILNTISGL